MPTIPAPESEPGNLDVNLLLASFLKIEPQANEFAETFYNILFTKYPEVQKLFVETNMARQRAKLIESLKLVMLNVHNSTNLTLILQKLGARHVEYGAVLSDYPLIGDALLQALEKHLGKDWNPQVQQTWVLAYQMIANTMADGAQTVGKSNVNLRIKDEALPASPTPQNHGSTNPDGKSGFAKLILLGGIGLFGIGGYMVWSVTHNSTNVNPPNQVEKSK